MRPHRVSYLRTTLGGLGLSALAAAVAVEWLLNGHVDLPVLGRISGRPHVMYWCSIAFVLLFAAFWLMVAAGGIIALQRDARESRTR
jgi:hypothetical protein